MIIIYGGAFNPPTKAHYLISKMLIERFSPDTFYFLPVGEKYNKKGMESYKNRFAMTSIMANLLPNALVSDKENEPNFRGTYYALKDFSLIDKDIYFVMGADNFDYLDRWIMAERLVRDFKFIILTRKGFDVFKTIEENFDDCKDNFTIIEVDLDMSSTEFRTLKNNDLILDEVYQYIKQNNLYEVI